MSKLKNLYVEWRWIVYNELFDLDVFALKRLKLHKKQYGSTLENIPKEIIEQYLNEDFKVSLNQIEKYHLKKKQGFQESLHKGYINIGYSNLNSSFIENCYIDLSQLSNEETKIKVRQNLIYYHWWNIMNDNGFFKMIILYFLESTKNLIDEQTRYAYLLEKYDTKKNLLDKIFENFNPSYETLSRLSEVSLNHTIFDYNWLFNNDLTRSIRIVENELRKDCGEKIIGAFYNEDLLFREVTSRFGEQYNVISQGSPEWLSPQRFDIYFLDLNIAIEYQGEQHFRPVDFGGKGKKVAKKQFELNRIRDELKIEKAKNNDCTLIFVEPYYNIDKVIDDIKNAITKKSDNPK